VKSDDAGLWASGAVAAVAACVLITAIIFAPAVVFVLGLLFVLGSFGFGFYVVSDQSRYDRAMALYERFRNKL
jgi:hypothetical protein